MQKANLDITRQGFAQENQ